MIATGLIREHRRALSTPAHRRLPCGTGESPFIGGATGPGFWVDPGTNHVYPLSYWAYRRAREAEERMPARHRAFAADIDLYLWGRGLGEGDRDVEVHLTVRPDAPPRVRRIVAEVLRAIRRGQPASEAIRQVARRFGLRSEEHTSELQSIRHIV